LKKLTQLDLFENKFDQLPDDIGDLSSLTDLLVSRNQLESLPESIGIYLLTCRIVSALDVITSI